MIDEIKPKKKISKWVWIIGGIIILIVIISLAGGNEKKESSQPSKLEIFNQTEQEKFNEIAEEFPDIESIKCFEEDCSVVYFNFQTIEDDLESVIRGNAATLSKRRLEQLGTSHVSVIGTHNGQTILTCEASQGKVDECK